MNGQDAMPEGAYTHITRDPFGKPTRIRRSNSSSPTGGTLAVNRDYTYNGFQELCRVTEPETGATLMGYDAASNLAWSASGLAASTACSSTGNETLIAQRKAVRTYDARNRVLSLSFPDLNGNQSWTYTPDGLPETVTTYNDGGATTVVNSYAYNKRRLLTSESSAQPGWYTFTAGYGYDGNGNLASLTYPGGLAVSYAPNALGQPTQAGTFATNVSYWPKDVRGRMFINNVLIEYRMRLLPNGTINVGTIFPVR